MDRCRDWTGCRIDHWIDYLTDHVPGQITAYPPYHNFEPRAASKRRYRIIIIIIMIIIIIIIIINNRELIERFQNLKALYNLKKKHTMHRYP